MMAHRLFNIAATISAVLCAATAILWVRSYWAGDKLLIATDHGILAGGGSVDGTIYCFCQRWRDRPFRLFVSTPRDRYDPSVRMRRRIWISLERQTDSFILWIPDWL